MQVVIILLIVIATVAIAFKETGSTRSKKSY